MPRKPAEYAMALGLAAEFDRRLAFLADAADVWLARGDLRRAAEVYDGLSLLAPNDPTGPLGLAEVFLIAERWSEAAAQARRAIHAWHCDRAQMTRGYLLTALALQRLGRIDEARRAADVVMKLDPEGMGGSLPAHLLAGQANEN